MRFSTALQDKYCQERRIPSPLFGKLEKLHELWYKINALDNKFSDIASRFKDRFTGEFFPLAQNVIGEMAEVFSGWVHDHNKEGWWGWTVHFVDTADSLESLGMGVDNCLLAKVEAELNEQIDWYEEFISTEVDYKAYEFLVDFYKVDATELLEIYGASDDETAHWHIENTDVRNFNLQEDFFEWSVRNGHYEMKVDLREQYDDLWFRYNKELGMKLLSECKDIAWEQFVSSFPDYFAALERVEQSVQNLSSVINSNDINEVMSVISLALNVAHNNGAMYEHIGLNEEEMNVLSNLDTSEWDAQMERFSKKGFKWLTTSMYF